MQIFLAGKIRIGPLDRPIETVAALDAHYREEATYGAAVLYDFTGRNLLEQRILPTPPARFPYLPGYLSFREIPALLPALVALSRKPDLLLVDGQGIAHPRGIGIASQLGILTGIPTVGCAKSRLIGSFIEPGPKKGEWSPLEVGGAVVGAVLRSRDRVRPLFVSPGHLITLEESIEVVLRFCSQFRIPEPMRRADQVARSATGISS